MSINEKQDCHCWFDIVCARVLPARAPHIVFAHWLSRLHPVLQWDVPDVRTVTTGLHVSGALTFIRTLSSFDFEYTQFNFFILDLYLVCLVSIDRFIQHFMNAHNCLLTFMSER